MVTDPRTIPELNDAAYFHLEETNVGNVTDASAWLELAATGNDEFVNLTSGQGTRRKFFELHPPFICTKGQHTYQLALDMPFNRVS